MLDVSGILLVFALLRSKFEAYKNRNFSVMTILSNAQFFEKIEKHSFRFVHHYPLLSIKSFQKVSLMFNY